MVKESLVIKKLDLIKAELDYIKNHMVDIDVILTPEENQRLDESLEEYEEGKTISLEDFEN